MATSQNGYRANDRTLIDYYRVPGSSIGFNLRQGDVARVLLYVAQQFDNHVEDIDTAGAFTETDAPPAITGGSASKILDDWSFAIRGGVSLSNHASGTAIDLNATQHPLGKEGTFTAEQVGVIKAILHDVVDPATKESVVRWGGNYSSRKDEMHFEIDAGLDAVARVAARIKTDDRGFLVIAQAPAPENRAPAPLAPVSRVTAPPFPLPKGHYFGPTSSDDRCHSGFRPADRPGVLTLQNQLKRRGWKISADGQYGPQTEQVVTAFQREKGLDHDGRCGQRTWPALWTAKVT
jgi:hypothetical protein